MGIFLSGTAPFPFKPLRRRSRIYGLAPHSLDQAGSGCRRANRPVNAISQIFVENRAQPLRDLLFAVRAQPLHPDFLPAHHIRLP